MTLIRRLTYDLTGLPPTPEEVDALPRRPSRRTPTSAWSTGCSPRPTTARNGAGTGSTWSATARPTATSATRPSRSPGGIATTSSTRSTSDKPYDQFIREQLAGDEIDPGSAESLIATGFYRLGIWDDEPADRPLARYDGLDGIVSTTGQVFLGMTVNCARCHDHKVDPIPQRDYYRLLAFFSDVDRSRRQEPEEGRRRPAARRST